MHRCVKTNDLPKFKSFTFCTNCSLDFNSQHFPIRSIWSFNQFLRIQNECVYLRHSREIHGNEHFEMTDKMAARKCSGQLFVCQKKNDIIQMCFDCGELENLIISIRDEWDWRPSRRIDAIKLLSLLRKMTISSVWIDIKRWKSFVPTTVKNVVWMTLFQMKAREWHTMQNEIAQFKCTESWSISTISNVAVALSGTVYF